MLSFPHLVVLFIIALLVFGPEKLPEIARQIGKVMGDFRKASTDFQRVIQQEFTEIERQQREKEEAARRKALEAANPASTAAAEPATAPQATPPASGSPTLGAATAQENSIAPPNTVANTAAKDSGYSARGTPANLGEEGAASSAPTNNDDSTAPSDVHPA